MTAREQILKTLSGEAWRRAREISERAKLPRGTVSTHLPLLIAEGLVLRRLAGNGNVSRVGYEYRLCV